MKPYVNLIEVLHPHLCGNKFTMDVVLVVVGSFWLTHNYKIPSKPMFFSTKFYFFTI